MTSFRKIFNDYFDDYFKVNPINRNLSFTDNKEALSINDVLVTRECDNVLIKQVNDDNTFTEANINLANPTGTIKIHDFTDNKEYECVKIIIDNHETDIDANLLKILIHPNYKLDNSFMFTIINKLETDFDPNNSETYSIIYSFNNFINTNFTRYETFRTTNRDRYFILPPIKKEQLIDYDIMIKKIIDNMIKIKIKMVNEISRKVQPNDIFFYKMRVDKLGKYTDNSPATNIHLDSCNNSLDNTEYSNNHYCEVTGIYYLNIINTKKDNYNSSALFFYGPEIPNPLSMMTNVEYSMEDLSEAKVGSSFFEQYKRVAYSIPIKSNSYVVWYNKPLKYKKFNIEDYDVKDNLFYKSIQESKNVKPNRIATPDSKNFMMHFSPISLRDEKNNKINSDFLPVTDGNRSFINPRMSNMNIFSTIRYIFSFDLSKDQQIQIKIRNDNLYSLCYIVLFYLNFKDLNSGEISFNILCEICSKIIKDILIKTFNIDLDKILFDEMAWNEMEKKSHGKTYYNIPDISLYERSIMIKIQELIKDNTGLITYQAKKFQELIKIRYETYFIKKIKNTIPFYELYEYLSSIQLILNPNIPHIEHIFDANFLKHISEKDEQYYKKYLKYKSKYINLKK